VRVSTCRLFAQVLFFLSAAALSPLAPASAQDADTLFQQGDYEQALAVSTDILARNPNDLGARLRAAEAALKLDRLVTAEKHFRTALKQDEDSPQALAGLGRLLARRSQLPEAADFLRAALRQDENDASVRLSLARVYQRMGDFDKAADELALILITDPEYPPARRALAHVESARNRPEQAVEHLEKLVQAGSATFPDYLELGLLCENLHDLVKAARYASKGAELNAENNQLTALLGRIAFADERYEDAVVLLKATLPSDPEYPESLLSLAQSYDALNKVNQAIAAYEDVLRVRENDAIAKRRLAALYEQIGRIEEARQLYMESLSGEDVDRAAKSVHRRDRKALLEKVKRFLAGNIFLNLLRATLLLLLAVFIVIRYRRRSKRLAERIEHVIRSIRRADDRVRKRDDN